MSTNMNDDYDRMTPTGYIMYILFLAALMAIAVYCDNHTTWTLDSILKATEIKPGN